ncbi:MAG: hypothetical protein SV775_13810 [Thermodesulfobacteriota bacterium]|nr:hypothetical protein [Thermodesulfobacteriota bacterium]
MWPGNTTNVKTLIPLIERVRSRFYAGRFYIIADPGTISADNVKELEQRDIPYIFGARMRKVKEIREEVLSHPDRYREVRPEGFLSKDPAPFKVKEITLNTKRFIVCLNPKQARKNARGRKTIIDSLQEKIKNNPKSLSGNKGYRKHIKIERESVSLNQYKIQ